ncbi:hypothetical protein BKA70DRAFT_567722 [Coprinopsis sp. MPI-PUGE-AT-0042]|nr:hypothetical protein BKA70DRAFT_567722 [Coprinopsis sp. MPI-PUGE-AT-0042]
MGRRFSIAIICSLFSFLFFPWLTLFTSNSLFSICTRRLIKGPDHNPRIPYHLSLNRSTHTTPLREPLGKGRAEQHNASSHSPFNQIHPSMGCFAPNSSPCSIIKAVWLFTPFSVSISVSVSFRFYTYCALAAL